MNKYIIVVILIVLCISCQHKQDTKIESINVLYYNYLFDRIVSVDCNEIIPTPIECDTFGNEAGEIEFIFQRGILDTAIVDKNVLQEIAHEIPRFKKEKDYGIDARMKCYINFSNGHTDSLCISDNPTYGYYNGKPTRLTNKFVYLIRKNCGFYQWIYTRAVRDFEELNDTTFVRDKVKSSTGEEY
jgi:hypothetical protein